MKINWKRIRNTGILSILVLLGASAIVSAQMQDDKIEKHFIDDGRGGDGILKNLDVSSDGSFINTKFVVDVPDKGKYYITAWANGQEKIQAYIDDTNPIGYIDVSGNDWKFVQLKDKAFDPIQISKGTHIISFRSREGSIEFIRLSKQKDKAILPDTEYQNYIQTLKSKTLTVDYKQLKTKNQLTGASIFAITCPLCDYKYILDTDFTYTYYRNFYFNAGQNVVFETKKGDPYASDPVMFLFDYNDPKNGSSWSNDDTVGFQSKLSVTIPRTGYYMLLLRAYNSGYPGTSDLYKDGSLYASNVALAGKNVNVGTLTKTGIVNYFTSHLTGDSRIWLQDLSTWPGKVKGFNDDYAGSGTFYWGLNSRVKNSFSPDIGNVLLSAYSTYTPTGRADLYMKLGNSNIMSYFPNLKADDAIKAAPDSGVYNCISWSGGITSIWIWPPSIGSPWYDPNPLTAFDKFYGNNPRRYTGAWTYTRSGATSSNNLVDLWAYGGSYTHGSVKKPGNDHPHGYDWESKPGGLMRTLHPRYALNGSSYGDVVAYYRWTGSYASSSTGMTLEESVAKGLTEIEKVELTTDEETKLTNSINNIPQSVRQEFNAKYNAWKETWDDRNLVIYSDPKMYTKSNEYSEFLTFNKKQGKSLWPLLFQKYKEGDSFVGEVIIDLTYADANYKSILDEIRQESSRERYTTKGVYISPSENANMMKYIKKLMTSK